MLVYWLKSSWTRAEKDIRFYRSRARKDLFYPYSSPKDWRSYARERDWVYYGPEHFVLVHGRSWGPRPLPKGYRVGRLGRCGHNACRLALRDPTLTYVEGFAFPAGNEAASWGLGALGHSWVVDPEGRVIDNTWRDVGTQYFGVPFKTSYLNEVCGEGFTGTLLDRWREGFPLLRTLGKRPGRWKETRFDRVSSTRARTDRQDAASKGSLTKPNEGPGKT